VINVGKKLILLSLSFVLVILATACSENSPNDNYPVDYNSGVKDDLTDYQFKVRTAVFSDYILLVKIISMSDPIPYNPDELSATSKEVAFTHMNVEIVEMFKGNIESNEIWITVMGSSTPWETFATPSGEVDNPEIGSTVLIFLDNFNNAAFLADSRFGEGYYICYPSELEFKVLKSYDESKDKKDQIKDIKDLLDDYDEIIQDALEKEREDYYE
jgi:hypothetical protein